MTEIELQEGARGHLVTPFIPTPISRRTHRRAICKLPRSFFHGNPPPEHTSLTKPLDTDMQASRLAGLIPNATLKKCNDAAHMPVPDHPHPKTIVWNST